jgi:hypothetical protein
MRLLEGRLPGVKACGMLEVTCGDPSLVVVLEAQPKNQSKTRSVNDKPGAATDSPESRRAPCERCCSGDS